MPIYTFYPYRADGSGLTFEAIELASDSEASSRACNLLRDHQSADCVEVWRDDEIVAAVRRDHQAVPAAAVHNAIAIEEDGY